MRRWSRSCSSSARRSPFRPRPCRPRGTVPSGRRYRKFHISRIHRTSSADRRTPTRQAQRNSNPAIGRVLFLSEATVKTHLGHVFEKLGVNDRTRAVTRAMELSLLP
ncbi:response regulator transcription factor [Curtobacterium sp. MCPF17_047]|uniref:response regulator transcription factor n=1 Tax=Curtobacterium sp. MCPF17_047 TaxID=2175654 RepID=UPI0035CB667E